MTIETICSEPLQYIETRNNSSMKKKNSMLGDLVLVITIAQQENVFSAFNYMLAWRRSKIWNTNFQLKEHEG